MTSPGPPLATCDVRYLHQKEEQTEALDDQVEPTSSILPASPYPLSPPLLTCKLPLEPQDPEPVCQCLIHLFEDQQHSYPSGVMKILHPNWKSCTIILLLPLVDQICNYWLPLLCGFCRLQSIDHMCQKKTKIELCHMDQIQIFQR